MQHERRTFEEWWNNLPVTLLENSSKMVENDDMDTSNKSVKKINYILFQLDLMTEKDYDKNKPTLEEFKFWFYSGQLNVN
ncbi:MAG: hypothetical protein ACRD8K_10920 [Nitrososphaeraceae archaeon]